MADEPCNCELSFIMIPFLKSQTCLSAEGGRGSENTGRKMPIAVQHLPGQKTAPFLFSVLASHVSSAVANSGFQKGHHWGSPPRSPALRLGSEVPANSRICVPKRGTHQAPSLLSLPVSDESHTQRK